MCIHGDLLPEEAIVTHMVTCQGRDHIVNIQSGRQIFTATLMSSETWGIGPFQVITQQYVLSFKNQQLGDTRANAFLAGCPAEFKVLLDKAKR